MAGKLKLIADSYDLPLEDEPQGNRPLRTKALSKGDTFTPRSDEDYERLIESGAAVDPKKENERKRQQLEDRRQELEAERARIDAELQSQTQPQSEGQSRAAALKGKALNDALKEHNLPAEGSDDEKRARLAGVIDNPASGPRDE